jgi:hypothetical protein
MPKTIISGQLLGLFRSSHHDNSEVELPKTKSKVTEPDDNNIYPV